MEKNHVTPTMAEISQVPKSPRDVDAEAGVKVMRLMDALDDHDDVQNVYTDMNMTDAIMAEASKG